VKTSLRPVHGDIDIWFVELMPYVEYDGQGQGARKAIVGEKVSNVIKGCPDYTHDGTGGWTYRPGYGMNYYLGRPDNWNRRNFFENTASANEMDFHQATVRYVSMRPLFGDSKYAGLLTASGTGNFQLSDGDEKRHGGRANYVFCDGHVEALSPEVAWRAIRDPTTLAGR
jgi:prepilin-type processing-associated H-X9-DG protein